LKFSKLKSILRGLKIYGSLKMLFYYVLLSFFLSLAGIIQPAENGLINVQNRSRTSLNGEWKIIVDPYENGYYNYRYAAFDNSPNPGKAAYFTDSKAAGKTELVEYDFDRSESLIVPGDWNTQNEKLFYYEGTVWYRKKFDFSIKTGTNQVFLYFGAVNYIAEVYLNGSKLGIHEGGFTPFIFNITDRIKEKDNSLVIKVDNKRIKEGVPTLNTDWWNYGGITRDVDIIEVPGTYISDYMMQLNPSAGKEITGYIKLGGIDISNRQITLFIPELNIKEKFKSDSNGKCIISLVSDSIQYWSPDLPKLYSVTIAAPQDTINDRIGFRTIKADGSKLLLNGRKIFLKGISIHEEKPFGGGRANSKEDALQLLNWSKELGCNFVRLAHYPHNEFMPRLADSLGIMLWEEIPVYWTIQWENESTSQNAENQLSEMIFRDKNRASVILWSMANETPVSEARNNFLIRLSAKARMLDKTRLISAALEQGSYMGDPLKRTISDPFAEVVDVLSFNQYIGWYDGTPEKAETITWEITQNKPVIISEFGGGAKAGYHGEREARWTEEYQAYLYEENIKMLQKIDKLCGMSPWILKDFRSPRRVLPGIQDGWNRKGLISEAGEKKAAFYVLKNFYENKN